MQDAALKDINESVAIAVCDPEPVATFAQLMDRKQVAKLLDSFN